MKILIGVIIGSLITLWWLKRTVGKDMEKWW